MAESKAPAANEMPVHPQFLEFREKRMDDRKNSKYTLLVTDDNPVNTRFLKILLEKEGFNILTANNGANCITLAKKEKPDLILLDIQMPGITGIDVCRILRQDPETKGVLIVFLTACTDKMILKEAFESGGTDYVTNPVQRIELLARLKSALNQKELIQKTLVEEKLRCVIEVAGGICHELNQPVMSVLGYAELLLMDLPKDHEMHRNVEKIKEQTERLGQITKKLMGITTYQTKDYMGGISQIIDIDRSVVPG